MLIAENNTFSVLISNSVSMLKPRGIRLRRSKCTNEVQITVVCVLRGFYSVFDFWSGVGFAYANIYTMMMT